MLCPIIALSNSTWCWCNEGRAAFSLLYDAQDGGEESNRMIDVLIENPLLLLFVVSAFGYAIGRIKIKGSSLGVAAVLFVGLAVGALDPRLALPEVIFLFGLVVFVYTIGL